MMERENEGPCGEPGRPSQNVLEEEAPVEHGSRPESIPAALRLILSILAGSPLVFMGIALLQFNAGLATWVGILIFLIGVMLVCGGIYFAFVGSTPRLDMMPGEKMLVLRHPSIKPALVRIMISIPFFAGAIYFLVFTEQSYSVYYFALSLVAMYLYFLGIIRYWLTHHTTYYVTNRRAVYMYRFLWLKTTEIPVKAINSISETRSLSERLTGRGSVVVASGIAETHKVRIEHIGNPEPVARTIRSLIG